MTKVEQLWFDIMTELYKQAEPSEDFSVLVEKYKGTDVEFYRDYYLDQAVQDDIISKMIGKSRLKKHDKKQVSIAVYLGCSPMGSK